MTKGVHSVVALVVLNAWRGKSLTHTHMFASAISGVRSLSSLLSSSSSLSTEDHFDVFAECKLRKTLTTASACFLSSFAMRYSDRRCRFIYCRYTLCNSVQTISLMPTQCEVRHLYVRAETSGTFGGALYNNLTRNQNPQGHCLVFTLCDAMIILFNEFFRPNSYIFFCFFVPVAVARCLWFCVWFIWNGFHDDANKALFAFSNWYTLCNVVVAFIVATLHFIIYAISISKRQPLRPETKVQWWMHDAAAAKVFGNLFAQSDDSMQLRKWNEFFLSLLRISLRIRIHMWRIMFLAKASTRCNRLALCVTCSVESGAHSHNRTPSELYILKLAKRTSKIYDARIWKLKY